jgi:glycosyltransferase involved in cell wall biosynthesis
MKILYHHRTASRDGQSTHIEEMIRALKSIGCSVDVAAPALPAVDAARTGSSGWVGRVKKLLPRPFYELAELAYSVVAYRRLAQQIKAQRPDGIYERYSLFLLAGVWARRRFGLPLILEVNSPITLERRTYGGLSWPWLADWTERFVWRRADAILPITQVMAQHLIAAGVEPARIRVVPNGVNEDHYRDLPSCDETKARLNLAGRLVIGFTGFVREWDELDRIVRWIAANRGAGVPAHLLVVGDGPARASIEQCARELGVTDRVTFTGVVPRERVPALAMAFDIALQTALVPYASPLCLFEYLALGKAIIAPDQPNHHEILQQRVNALLYDPADRAGVEKALDELARDDALRRAIAGGARDVIAAKGLTWKHHASTVTEILSKLAGRPAPAGVIRLPLTSSG